MTLRSNDRCSKPRAQLIFGVLPFKRIVFVHSLVRAPPMTVREQVVRLLAMKFYVQFPCSSFVCLIGEHYWRNGRRLRGRRL